MSDRQRGILIVAVEARPDLDVVWGYDGSARTERFRSATDSGVAVVGEVGGNRREKGEWDKDL